MDPFYYVTVLHRCALSINNPSHLFTENLDQDVLDFMAYREQRRGRGAGNVRAPTTNRRRQPWQVALNSALSGNVAMLNESSDYEVLNNTSIFILNPSVNNELINVYVMCTVANKSFYI